MVFFQIFFQKFFPKNFPIFFSKIFAKKNFFQNCDTRLLQWYLWSPGLVAANRDSGCLLVPCVFGLGSRKFAATCFFNFLCA